MMNCEGTISMHTLYSFHKNGNFITAKEEELEETLGSIIAAGLVTCLMKEDWPF